MGKLIPKLGNLKVVDLSSTCCERSNDLKLWLLYKCPVLTSYERIQSYGIEIGYAIYARCWMVRAPEEREYWNTAAAYANKSPMIRCSVQR